MISPAGLPVPKKVTARKQAASASPSSGDFRDAVLNTHPARALGPTPTAALQGGHSTWHCAGGTQILGWEERGQEEDSETPPWSLLQLERRAGCSRCPGRSLLRFP